MRECLGSCVGGDWMLAAGPRAAGRVTRRTVAIGAGAAVTGLLAACAGDSPTGGSPPGGSPPGGDVAPGTSDAAASGTIATVPAADVPIGGGVVLPEGPLVVTQPEPGTFRAFSGICTHQGCSVTRVANGKIVCPCHSSMFAVGDGSVVGGPATEPLPELAVELEGDTVVVTGT